MNDDRLLNKDRLRQLWAKSYQDDPQRFHPLWCHVLDVAAVCQALLPRFGGIPEMPNEWLLYLVGLHDVGKADARFQGKAPELAVGLALDTPGNCVGFRHEARSADWIWDHLSGIWGTDAARVTMQAIRGHHGDFQAGSEPGADYSEQKDYPHFFHYYSPLREQLARLIADTVQLPPLTLTQFADASAAGMKLSGLIVLSDWIASNSETYHYPILMYHYSSLQTEMQPVEYYAAACAEARAAVARLELDGDAEAAKPRRLAFSDVWPECAVLRPSQKALEEAVFAGIPPGLAIIEAPMGEGKTEAALYLAACWNRCGAYIALPTQATSNQMHGRYKAFLARTDPRRAPRLVHGMAWLLDAVTPEEGARTEGRGDEERLLSREWFASAKRALLASDGVGTVDQVLMAALNVRHGFLRFLGLTTKTLIIDEVHAYDVYMTTLMTTLLQWCRVLDIPVILLSATLSRRQKQELAEAYGGPGALSGILFDASQEPYPLLTFVPGQAPAFVKEAASEERRRRTVVLRRHPGVLHDAVTIARLAQEAVAGGGCACVLANTVGAAQAIFQALQPLMPAEELFLFHARFRAERRQEIEEQIASLFGKNAGDKRPRRAVVVGTQVLEQSLDIDFDVMLTQIAPIDLLLQRCGRLHRHVAVTRPADQPAVLHLLLPDDNGEPPKFKGMGIKRVQTKKGIEWRGVYDQATLLRTLALLESRAAFHLPADFRPLIESCYGDVPLPVSSIAAEWIESAEKLREERRAGSKRKAEEHLIASPDEEEFSYANKPEPPVSEGDEGERASFFRAQTREGSDTRDVLILHDPVLIAEVLRGSCLEKETDQEWRPARKMLKRLFLQKASLPVYWLAGVEPAEGYEWIAAADAPKRLRHHAILMMPQDMWGGVQTNKDEQGGKLSGTRITITDDDTLGLYWIFEKQEDEAR